MFPQDGNTFFGFDLLYSEFFFKAYVANRHPLAMILTPVDQRLQSHIHTVL